MIRYEDIRRYCFATIEGLYNPDIRRRENLFDDPLEDYQEFVGDLFFTAKITGVSKSSRVESIEEGLDLGIVIEELLAGFPDNIAKPGGKTELLALAKSLLNGKEIPYINPTVMEDLQSLEVGGTYLFRAYSALGYDQNVMKPLFIGGPLYEKLDDGKINWADEKFAKVKEDIDVLSENVISYRIITTKDMSKMPITHPDSNAYFLREGRWVDEEDDKQKKKVCVINEDLAKLRGVSVGDTLSIDIKSTEKGRSYLVTDKDRKEWREYPHTGATDYEVVGIFGFRHALKSLTRGREIYIPDSTLPEEFGRYPAKGLDEPAIYFDSYSFVLADSSDEKAFREKYDIPLAELGYTLSFLENNAEGFWNAAKPILKSVQTSAALFGVILLFAFFLVLYLYISGQKLSYAIERSLGVPERRSLWHLSFPLLLPGILALVVGGYYGYSRAQEKAQGLLKGLSQHAQGKVSSSVDLPIYLLLMLALIAVFLVFLLLYLLRLKRMSIIELLQQQTKKNKERKSSDKLCEESTEEKNYSISQIDHSLVFRERKKALPGGQSIKHKLFRFSLKNTLRSPLTSISSVLLAGIFVFVLLQMNAAMKRNQVMMDEAYANTQIRGEILSSSSERFTLGPQASTYSENYLTQLQKTGLLKDYLGIAVMNYEKLFFEKDRQSAEEATDLEEINLNINALTHPASEKNDLEIKDLNLEGASLDDFYKKYRLDSSTGKILDEDEKEGFPILVSNKAMEEYGLSLGDKVCVSSDARQVVEAYGTIVGNFSLLDRGRVPRGFVALQEEEALFIYPLEVLRAIEPTGIYYDLLEFDFRAEKNRELLKRKDELKESIAKSPYNVAGNTLEIWDEELVNVVEPLEKNLSLLSVLYPVTFVMSFLLSALIAALILLRRSIDVAVLRVLGVKKREVRWNLFWQYFVLVFLGVLLAASLVYMMSFKTQVITLDKYASVTFVYLMGSTLGILLGIAKITKMNPIDLLQDKE